MRRLAFLASWAAHTLFIFLVTAFRRGGIP